MIPRPYQTRIINAVEGAYPEHRRILFSSATGTGKGVMGAMLANNWLADADLRQGKRAKVLWLAHRDELINQAVRDLEEIIGEKPAIEKGQSHVHATAEGFWSKVVVASVQSLMQADRRAKHGSSEYGLVIADEAHHFVSEHFSEVVQHFYPATLVGMTATVDRSDRVPLRQIFDHVPDGAYYGIVEAIRDGWLCPIKQQHIHVDLDFSKVRQSSGDLSAEALDEIICQEEFAHNIAAPTVKLAGDRPTIVFCPRVASAEMVAGLINRYAGPGSAHAVSGETPLDLRREIVSDFRHGRHQFMVNAMVFCLDAETEILTDDGWKGPEALLPEDRIANWKREDGTIFFDTPKAIIRRPRAKHEGMVRLENRGLSIRVSDTHTMLYRTDATASFRPLPAQELLGRKFQIPISGIAEPLPMRVQQPETPTAAKRHRAIISSSHAIRKRGWPVGTSHAEAARRFDIRQSLRYKQPSELSEAECNFIGFWIGDGSVTKLQSGGLEYTATQSRVYPNIINWFDSIIAKCELDVVRHNRKTHLHGQEYTQIRWSFGRGTGGGSQERRGLFHLEPYLNKSGVKLFWALDEKQFRALLVGFWYADGWHGQAESVPKSLRICNANLDLLSLLQAIAVCRGFSANITHASPPVSDKHKQVYNLVVFKSSSRWIVRPQLALEDDFHDEELWCVTSTSGYIVTRRHKTVTIMGNCEGVDFPSVSCIVIARPTKSRMLMSQMVGRGLRGGPLCPIPGKEDCLVVDLVGASKHKLVTAVDLLGGDFTAEVIEEAHRRVDEQTEAGEVPDTLAELLAAEQIKDELERQRRIKVLAEAKLTRKTIDPFITADLPERETPDWWQGDPMTDKQSGMLKKNGVPTAGLDYGKAQQLCKEITRRAEVGECSFKQARILGSHGYDRHFPMELAGELFGWFSSRREGFKFTRQEAIRINQIKAGKAEAVTVKEWIRRRYDWGVPEPEVKIAPVDPGDPEGWF